MGIGAEFARQLAAVGLDLVLVAERDEPLVEVAAEIAGNHGVRVETIVADLGRLDDLARLREKTADREIGMLVYNAAAGYIGRSLEQDESSRQQLLDVNCRAPLTLASAFGQDMATRGRGGIVLMSSMSGFQGTAGVTVYAATKAFNLVLGEGLWAELRPHGVDVLSVCPGPVNTPGWTGSGPRLDWTSPPVSEPAAVVREALEALGSRPSMVPGRFNRATAFALQRLLPRSRLVRLMAASLRRLYPRQLG